MRHSFFAVFSCLTVLTTLAIPNLLPTDSDSPRIEAGVTPLAQPVSTTQEADVATNNLRQTSDDEKNAPTATATANQRVYDELEKTVSMDFQDQEFSEVMDCLREEHNLNVILDISATDDSLPLDEPIQFQIRETRLKDALRLLLRPKNACIVVKHGVLRIVSCDVAPEFEYHERRIIDVKQILATMDKIDRPREEEQASNGSIQIFVNGGMMGGMMGGGGAQGGGFFQVADQQQDGENAGDTEEKEGAEKIEIVEDPNRDAIQAITSGGKQEVTLTGNFIVNHHRYSAEDRLTQLIEDTVYPESWQSTNGEGRLNIVGGLLVVVNRFEVNDEIQDFIKELEYHLSR